MSSTVVTHRPPPALAPFVSSISYFEGRFSHDRELVLPSGTMQLLVNLDSDHLHSYDASEPATGQRTNGAALQGPSVRPCLVDPAEQRAILCVAFRPGGTHPFFPTPAEATCGQLVDLAQLWGRDGAVLPERLREAGPPPAKLRRLAEILVASAVRPLEPDPAIALAAAALHRGASVTAVADRLGWASRRLRRRFTERIGLEPKRWARVRRFQRLLAAVREGVAIDWARRAAECGYHDQAHLIHEFRAFAGMTPTRYAPRSPDERNHVPL